MLLFILIQISYFGINGQICSNGFTGPSCKDECGKTFKTANIKLIGGEEAVPNSWPSTAYILMNYTFDVKLPGLSAQQVNYIYPCAGSLIDRFTVLTSARCFINQIDIEYNGKILPIDVQLNKYHSTFESMYSVYLGMHNISAVFSGANLAPGIRVSVKRFILRWDFDRRDVLNDLALIKLETEVVPSNNIQPACLPSTRTFPIKTNLDSFSTGWGRSSQSVSISKVLNNVKFTIFDQTKCSGIFPSFRKSWTNQICAGSFNGTKSLCDGDVGAPLYVSDSINGKTKFLLAGIASYGDSCNSPKSPGIFTRVSSYLTWIQRNAGKV